MGILNKVTIENFLEQTTLYSKLIRGNLSFTAETHILDRGKKLQVYLYRDHPQILKFIEKATEKELLKRQVTNIDAGIGVLRLTLNDQKFMINTAEKTTINIQELNFNPKGLTLTDFSKGKVAMLIEFNFSGEADNLKFKQEIKNMFMEEKDEGKIRGTSD